MKKTVVITGMGAVSALGVGATPLHARWADGVVGIDDGAGRAREFEPKDFLSVKEARRLDRFSQFALVTAQEAITQAGWDGELPYDPLRTSCIVATGIGGISTVEANHDLMRDRGPERISPLGIPGYMPNAAAAWVSMKHGLQGQMFGVVSACSSGGHALGLGMRMIQYGDADAVVAGGSEATLTEFGFACFNAMQALSPTGESRPFDKRRNGFVMGEGAGMLVLEEKEAAIARGATIIAELAGYGSTSDAHHLTAPDPSGVPASRALELAIADAGASADDVAYVNAHGTSTELNDAAETAAIKRALGDRAMQVPVSSLKSSIGHLLGAAGAVEAVVTAEVLRSGVVPPTLGYGEPDEGLDLDYVADGKRELTPAGDGPALAISNSFAFGGHNVCLALRASS